MKKYLFGVLIGLGAFTLVGGAVALASTGNGFGMFGDGSGHERMIEVKADILGIPADELEAQLEEHTFPELLDEQGISHEELQEQMHTQMEARMTERLQQMVDDGNITEEQMQEKLDFMAERHEQCEETGECGKHDKGGFGRGMMHGPMVDENGDGVCDFRDKE